MPSIVIVGTIIFAGFIFEEITIGLTLLIQQDYTFANISENIMKVVICAAVIH